MEIGQIVFSKQGRDKDYLFVVYATDLSSGYVYLVDGKHRTLDKPKKKKIKHVNGTTYVAHTLADVIRNKAYLLDSDIRKVLKAYAARS